MFIFRWAAAAEAAALRLTASIITFTREYRVICIVRRAACHLTLSPRFDTSDNRCNLEALWTDCATCG